MKRRSQFSHVMACNFHLAPRQQRAIREIRRIYGVSQQRIADWVGCSQTTVSRVLRSRKVAGGAS